MFRKYPIFGCHTCNIDDRLGMSTTVENITSEERLWSRLQFVFSSAAFATLL